MAFCARSVNAGPIDRTRGRVYTSKVKLSSAAGGLCLVAAMSAPARAQECSMTSYTACVKAAAGGCVETLQTIRGACNLKSDNAQARMQDLGSVDSKEAKPEMAAVNAALNTLYAVSREAQQLSYKDPKALELLKAVNIDTGEQQYRMQRTYEIVDKKQAAVAAAAAQQKAPGSKPPPVVRAVPKGPAPTRVPASVSAGAGAGSTPATEDDAKPAGPAPGLAEKGAAKGAKALSAAQGLAGGLKSDERSADDLAGGPAGAAAKGGGAADPKTRGDLLQASMSGFKGAFDALGLRVAGSAILGPDGKPASPEALARLEQRIRAEPTALLRRPDFFSVITPSRFAQLKGDFMERADLRETSFKHIGLTPSERDFQRTASCQTLSGGCNPAAAATYKKGDDVSPEDLRTISLALHAEEEEERAEPRDGRLEEAIAADQPDAADERPFRPGLRARVDEMINAFKSILPGGLSGAPAAAGDVSAGGADRGFASVEAGSPAAAPVAVAAKKRAAQVPPGVHEERGGAPRRLPVLVLGVAAAAAAAFLLRKKKTWRDSTS